MVASTPAADSICVRNGLTIVELLRYHGHLSNLQATFNMGDMGLNTANAAVVAMVTGPTPPPPPIQIKELSLRFHAANTIFQPTPEAIESHMQEVLARSSLRHVPRSTDSATSDHDDLLQQIVSCTLGKGGRGSGAQEPTVNIQGLQKKLQQLQLSVTPPSSTSAMLASTPWYKEYRDELFRVLQFGDHESIDHPVGVIYVIPADVPGNPVSHLEALQNQPSSRPPMMQLGDQVGHMLPVGDKDFPKHYLLLLDASSASEGAERRALENFTTLSRAFGEASCTLLKINTCTGDKAGAGAAPDSFRRVIGQPFLPSGGGGGAGEMSGRPPVPPQGLGAFLSPQDLAAVKNLVHRFAIGTLLPKLEERFLKLNAGITATRRGLRNRITRLWKGGSEGEAAVVDRPYAWHSIEAQMRQLGDLAFLLKQYDFAASVYRLAAQDYLAHNNSRWYAGAEEMIGYCCILAPSDTNADAPRYFSRAYEHYCRILASPQAAQSATGKTLPRMLATRAMILCAEHLAWDLGKYLSASQILMRAHFEEENSRAALLLEQAAYLLLLQPQQPSVRKFAFQMVLAGLRYQSCGQRRLAMQAYLQVLPVYRGRNWKSVEEHLAEILLHQSREDLSSPNLSPSSQGQIVSSMLLYSSTLVSICDRRPPHIQQAYLDAFLDATRRSTLALKSASGTSLLLPSPSFNRNANGSPLLPGGLLDPKSHNLPLPPLVDIHNFLITLGPADKANAAPEATSRSRTPSSSSSASHLMTATAWARLEACLGDVGGGGANWLDPAAKAKKESEEYNACVAGEPVSVSLKFSNPLQIKLKLSNLRLLCDFSPGLGGGSTSGSSGCLVSDSSLTLHPNETSVEELRVTPLAAGWLRITGVQWLLNDSHEVSCELNPKGRLRKHPKGQWPGQRKILGLRRRTLCGVVPAMPRLECQVSGDEALGVEQKQSGQSAPIQGSEVIPSLINDPLTSHPLSSDATESRAAGVGPSPSPSPLAASSGSNPLQPSPALSLLEGEVKILSLALTNHGTLPLTNLQLSTTCVGAGFSLLTSPLSSSSSLSVTTPASLLLEEELLALLARSDHKDGVSVIEPTSTLASLEGNSAVTERSLVQVHKSLLSSCKTCQPQQILPGETVVFRALVNAMKAGTLSFHFCWYYEPYEPSGNPTAPLTGHDLPMMRSRLLRQTVLVESLPLLMVRLGGLQMIPGSVEAMQLRMDLSIAPNSLSATDEFSLKQLATCLPGSCQKDSEESQSFSWGLVEASSLPPIPLVAPKQQMVRMSEAREAISRSLVSSCARILSPYRASIGGGRHWTELRPGAQEPVAVHLFLLPHSMISARKDQPRDNEDLNLTDLNLTNPGPILRSVLSLSNQNKATVATKRGGGSSSSPSGPTPPSSIDPPVNLIMSWMVSSAKESVRRGFVSVPIQSQSQGQGQGVSPSRLRMILSGSHLPSASASSLTQPPPLLPLFHQQSICLPVSTRHDFKANVLCAVPLLLLVRNCSSEEASILVETGGWSSSFSTRGAWVMAASQSSSQATNEPQAPGGAVQTVQAGLAPTPDYVWCGRTRLELDLIEPGGVRNVEGLEVCFFRPGSYLVQGCSITARFSRGGVETLHSDHIRIEVVASGN